MNRRATICMLLDCFLSCLSVMSVYCGQTVGWIKMPLGTQVGLGPDHIELDGDSAPPHGKGHNSPLLSQFADAGRINRSPRLSWPSGWMDQDATWYGGGPRSRRHCVRWVQLPHGKVHSSPTPLFSPHLLGPNS